MGIRRKSFWVAFAVAATMAIALSALPTYAALDLNQQAEFCVWIDGSPLVGERDDCVIHPLKVFERFMFYFAFYGGAILGPFGLFIMASLAKAAIQSLVRSVGGTRPRSSR